MKITQHTTSNLITKDSSGCLWLFGLFFVVIAGTFAAGLLGLFTNLHELNELERAAIWFVSLAGVAAGFWFIYSNPSIKVSFDKREGEALISITGLMKNETEKYPLNEIKDVTIKESKDDDGDPIYAVEMILKSGSVIRLTKLWLRDKEGLQKNINDIKSFLN